MMPFMNECPDNWYDLKHKGENLLIHFSDGELEGELNRRKSERRKLEIVKINNGRDAVAYFELCGEGEAVDTEWELHIVYSDGSSHCFTFASKVGQTEDTRDEFRKAYYPEVAKFGYDDYIRFKNIKAKKKGKKNGNCISA